MRCIKAYGERIAARHPDRQTAEIQIRGAFINRFNALGTADIILPGLSTTGKGEVMLQA